MEASPAVSFPPLIYRVGCRSVPLCVTLQLGIYVVSTRDKMSRVKNLLKKEENKERKKEEKRKWQKGKK